MAKLSASTLRNIVSGNIVKLMESMGWTSTELMLKLNEQMYSNQLTMSEMSDFTEGKRTPSLFITTLIASYFKVTVNDLLDANFDPANSATKGFAQLPTSPSTTPMISIPAVIATNPTPVPVISMTVPVVASVPTIPAVTAVSAKTTTVVTRTKATHNKYTKLIDARIKGCTNYALAYAVYKYCASNKLTLSEFAYNVNSSRRSLRDYFTGTSVPAAIAHNLCKTLKSTYKNLGLSNTAVDFRHSHLVITIV